MFTSISLLKSWENPCFANQSHMFMKHTLTHMATFWLVKNSAKICYDYNQLFSGKRSLESWPWDATSQPRSTRREEWAPSQNKYLFASMPK